MKPRCDFCRARPAVILWLRAYLCGECACEVLADKPAKWYGKVYA